MVSIPAVSQAGPPARAGKKSAVMVWIHGGCYVSGSPYSAAFNGSRLVLGDAAGRGQALCKTMQDRGAAKVTVVTRAALRGGEAGSQDCDAVREALFLGVEAANAADGVTGIVYLWALDDAPEGGLDATKQLGDAGDVVARTKATLRTFLAFLQALPKVMQTCRVRMRELLW